MVVIYGFILRNLRTFYVYSSQLLCVCVCVCVRTRVFACVQIDLFCKEPVFWDVTPYTLVEVDQHFEGMYCLHVHCWRGSQTSSSCFFLGWLTLQHWRWRMYVFSKTVDLYQTTQHHIAEASTSQSLPWKPQMNFFFSSSNTLTHYLCIYF